MPMKKLVLFTCIFCWPHWKTKSSFFFFVRLKKHKTHKKAFWKYWATAAAQREGTEYLIKPADPAFPQVLSHPEPPSSNPRTCPRSWRAGTCPTWTILEEVFWMLRWEAPAACELLIPACNVLLSGQFKMIKRMSQRKDFTTDLPRHVASREKHVGVRHGASHRPGELLTVQMPPNGSKHCHTKSQGHHPPKSAWGSIRSFSRRAFQVLLCGAKSWSQRCLWAPSNTE